MQTGTRGRGGAAALVIALAACSPGASSADASDAMRSNDTRAGGAGGSVRPPALDASMCVLEFPCWVGNINHFCTDRTHYQHAVDRGSPGCTGSTCTADGPVIECDPGTICAPMISSVSGAAPCVPDPDGGTADDGAPG